VTGAYIVALNPAFGGFNRRFGTSLSVSGNRVLIADNPSDSPYLSHAHLYNVSGNYVENFARPAGNADFGDAAVFLSGSLLGVAATGVNTVNTFQGAAYLYSRTTMTSALSAGNLTIGTVNAFEGADNFIRVVRDGVDLLITDSDEMFVSAPAEGSLENGGRTLRIPWGVITGSLTINGNWGSDNITLDFSSGDVIPAAGLVVSGNQGTNSLSIAGGDQGDVTYTDTSVALSAYGAVTFSSIAAVQNTGTAANANIVLRSNPTTIADDGVAANGLTQVTNSSMPTFLLASPSNQLMLTPNGNANTFNLNPLPDFVSNLVVGTDADRVGNVNLSGSISFAPNRSWTAFATGMVTQNVGSSLAMSGSGNLSLTTARPINLFGVRTSTVDGNLLLSSNQQAVPANGGSGANIYLHTGTVVESTGAGNVTLLSRGRTSASDGNIGVYLYGAGTRLSAAGGVLTVVGQGNGSNLSANNHGVLVEAGAMIRGGAGGVSVDGTGGTTSTTTGSNHGVFVRDSGSQITSNNSGNVLVRGTSGLAATSFSAGVYAFGLATISAGGTGTLTVEGRGSTLSTATASGHRGVVVDSGTITSSGGNITVSGWGGGAGETSGGNYGVYVRNSNDAGPGRILSTFNAAVTVNGTGGNAGAESGNNNYGVFLTETGSGVFGTNGAVSVTGIGGGSAVSTGNTGIIISNEAKVASTGNFAELRTDALQLASANSVQLPAAGTLLLRTFTPGLPIHMGGADVPDAALGISNTDLNSISGTSIEIGDAVAGGDILVTEPVSRTVSGNVSLVAGASQDIALGANAFQLPAGSELLLRTIGSGQVTTADQTGSHVAATKVVFSSATALQIRLANPSLFDHLSVTGQVALAGTLNLTPLNGYLPFTAGKLVILQNDGSDPIVGNFSAGDGSSLPGGTVLNEGAVFSNNLFGTGMAATISYVGGDGNDVELTLSPAREIPTARIVDNRLLVTGTTRHDIILVSPVNNQVRVRVGNRVLGLFDNVTGISIDGLRGNDFVYVAPFLPATVVTTETDPVVASLDLIFAGDNTDVVPLAEPATNEPQSVRDAILIQLLLEWTAEYNQLYPGGSQNPSVRRR
jgi:hypothetical protein